MIYKEQYANIKLNGFALQKMVLQKCPLSHLLYNLVIETLAIVIQDNKNIELIKIDTKKYKLVLYADDIVCFLRKLVHSIKGLNDILDRYGKVSDSRMIGDRIEWKMK